MKILALPDLHITNKKPKNRLDEDFYTTILNKLKYIKHYAEDNFVNYIFQPGDFFDHHTISKEVISDVIDIINPYKNDYCNVFWYGVYGQHDLVNHSPNIRNTPLNILNAAGVIKILTHEPLQLGNIHFYGASWNEEIPKVQDKNAFNILVTHKMIIKEDKIWEGQNTEDYTKSYHLLRHSDFNLIISGDNHNSFTDKYRSKYLLNCGSLIRNRIDQEKHEPHFYFFNTETKKPTQVKLPVEPFNKIMDLDNVEKEESFKQKKSELIAKLRDKNIVGLDFRKKAIKMSYSSKLNKNTQNYVFKAIGASEDEIKRYRKPKKRLVKRK